MEVNLSQISKEYAIKKFNSAGQIYLAGGWFNPEAHNRYCKVLEILRESGFRTYAPEEHPADNFANQEKRDEVFISNLGHIESAPFVLAITNGKDMGTLFECGYAYGKGIPIIYFAEGLEGEFNLMLAKSGCLVLTSFHDLKCYLNDPQFLNWLLALSGIKKAYIEYSGTIE